MSPLTEPKTYVDRNADRLLDEIEEVSSALSRVAQGEDTTLMKSDLCRRRLRRAETALADLRQVWQEKP